MTSHRVTPAVDYGLGFITTPAQQNVYNFENFWGPPKQHPRIPDLAMDKSHRRLAVLNGHIDDAGYHGAGGVGPQAVSSNAAGSAQSGSSYDKMHGRGGRHPAQWVGVPAVYQLKLEETLYKKAPKDGIAKARTPCMHATARSCGDLDVVVPEGCGKGLSRFGGAAPSRVAGWLIWAGSG